MSDYRIIVKVKNARILRAMEAAGIDSVSDLARRANAGTSHVATIINLQTSPKNRNGDWRPVVLSISAALGVEPEFLFSENQLVNTMKSNARSFDAHEDDIEAALSSMSENTLLLEDNLNTKQVAEICLAKLTPRERDMVERVVMRGETQTAVGADYGLNKTRVGQIVARAQRKMRAHAINKNLVRKQHDY